MVSTIVFPRLEICLLILILTCFIFVILLLCRGLKAKAERSRQQEEAQRLVKNDFSDPFQYKRPKEQNPPPIAAIAGTVTATAATKLVPQASSSVRSPILSKAVAPSAPNSVIKSVNSTPLKKPSIPAKESLPVVNLPAQLTLPGPQIAQTSQIAANSASVQREISLPAENLALRNVQLVHAARVELFEMNLLERNSKGYGDKGLALVKTIDDLYLFLVYDLSSKATEFSLEIDNDFDLILLPDRFATFSSFFQGRERGWSVKFSTISELHEFSRAFALCKDDFNGLRYAQQGERRVIKQDLAMGAPDAPRVELGDIAKCKYSIHTASAQHPMGLGACLVSKTTGKFTVGEGLINVFMENALIGMRMKGSRLIIVPPQLSEPLEDIFSPIIEPNSTLIIEISLVSHDIHVNHSQNYRQKEQILPKIRKSSDEGEKSKEKPSQSEIRPSSGENNSGSGNSSNNNSRRNSSTSNEETPQSHGENTENRMTSAALSLKERMKNLTSAQNPAGIGFSESILGQKLKKTAEITEKVAPKMDSSRDKLADLLEELGLSEALAKFHAEGIGFDDLLGLEYGDLQQLVPQLGPRKRLQFKLNEIKAEQQGKGESKGNSSRNNAGEKKDTSVAAAESSKGDQSISSSTAQSKPQPKLTQPSESNKRPQAIVSASIGSNHTKNSATEKLQLQQQSLQPNAAAPNTNNGGAGGEMTAAESAAYERGQQSAISQCRARIDQLKEQANSRFSELTAELEGAQSQLLAQRAAAHQKIAELKKEREEMFDKSSAYVAQMKAQRSEDRGKELKQSMAALFELVQANITVKQLYEGKEVLEIIKKSIKQTVQQQIAEMK
jgi:hypothetical protein